MSKKPSPIDWKKLRGKMITPEDLETQLIIGEELGSVVQWFVAERFSFGVALMPPGGGHGKHSHPGVEEALYVLSGEMDEIYYPEEKRYRVKPGSMVHIPPGKEHATEVKGWEPVKVIAVYVPAGPESSAMLRESPDCTIIPPGKIPTYGFKKLK